MATPEERVLKRQREQRQRNALNAPRARLPSQAQSLRGVPSLRDIDEGRINDNAQIRRPATEPGLPAGSGVATKRSAERSAINSVAGRQSADEGEALRNALQAANSRRSPDEDEALNNALRFPGPRTPQRDGLSRPSPEPGLVTGAGTRPAGATTAPPEAPAARSGMRDLSSLPGFEKAMNSVTLPPSDARGSTVVPPTSGPSRQGRDPSQIPGFDRAVENVGAAVDGQTALRELQQRPGFRFASSVGEFGEPVFDNNSIKRLEAADPESLRGGLSVVPALEQDLTAAGLARDLQAGLRTEEEVAQILDSQDISNRARIGDDANQIAAFRAKTERDGLRGGSRDASREIFTPRFDSEGNFVESVLSKDVSAKQAESFTNTMSRPLATIAPDLGFESTEAAQGAFQTYLMNSSNQRGEGDDAIPANPAILFSAFALNRALSDEAGVSTPNTFQAGIDVLGEYVATEAPTLFGFGSAAGNVAGGSAKFDNLPAEVKRELNANRQAVKDSLLGQLGNPIGRKFNASYATGVAEQLKGVADQLESASRVRTVGPTVERTGQSNLGRGREVQQALEQTGTLERIKTLRERARELSQGIISGEITDPTAVQALDAQMAEIGEQIQGSAVLRQATGVELDSLRTR